QLSLMRATAAASPPKALGRASPTLDDGPTARQREILSMQRTSIVSLTDKSPISAVSANSVASAARELPLLAPQEGRYVERRVEIEVGTSGHARGGVGITNRVEVVRRRICEGGRRSVGRVAGTCPGGRAGASRREIEKRPPGQRQARRRSSRAACPGRRGDAV